MNQLYWYTYRLRGLSIGCQPEDFVKVDYNYGKYEAIAYERELTEEEIEEYELIPL